MKSVIYISIIILTITSCARNTKTSQSNKLDRKEANDKTATNTTAPNAPTSAEGVDITSTKNKIRSKQQNINKQLEKEQAELFSIEVLAAEELPPVKGIYVKLMIRNNHKTPMWYLLPRTAQQSLGTSSKLQARKDKKQPFHAKLFKGTINEQNEGQLIEITMYGDKSQGFKAFYLPPMSSITFRNYEINGDKAIEQMELWSASALWVNAKKPLEDWLPYEVLSDANVKVHCNKNTGCDWDNLDWNNDTDAIRTDYPKETVSYIQAKSPKKHYISLKGIEH